MQLNNNNNNKSREFVEIMLLSTGDTVWNLPARLQLTQNGIPEDDAPCSWGEVWGVRESSSWRTSNLMAARN